MAMLERANIETSGASTQATGAGPKTATTSYCDR
jgi:hypothetical protein